MSASAEVRWRTGEGLFGGKQVNPRKGCTYHRYTKGAGANGNHHLLPSYGGP